MFVKLRPKIIGVTCLGLRGIVEQHRRDWYPCAFSRNFSPARFAETWHGSGQGYNKQWAMTRLQQRQRPCSMRRCCSPSREYTGAVVFVWRRESLPYKNSVCQRSARSPEWYRLPPVLHGLDWRETTRWWCKSDEDRKRLIFWLDRQHLHGDSTIPYWRPLSWSVALYYYMLNLILQLD
jgi:hypothetical protein